MTIEKAKQALREGKKVTHYYMSEGEWVELKDGKIVSEDGVTHSEFWQLRTSEGWQTDWEIFMGEEEKKFVDDFIDHFSKIPNVIPMPIFYEEKRSNFIPERGGNNQNWKKKGKGR